MYYIPVAAGNTVVWSVACLAVIYFSPAQEVLRFTSTGERTRTWKECSRKIATKLIFQISLGCKLCQKTGKFKVQSLILKYVYCSLRQNTVVDCPLETS
jgi:hypothetical protein